MVSRPEHDVTGGKRISPPPYSQDNAASHSQKMVINHTAQLATLLDKVANLDKKVDDGIKGVSAKIDGDIEYVDDKIDNRVEVINKELEKQYNLITKQNEQLKEFIEKERQRYDVLENKIDDIYKWLLATIAAFVVSLLMFLFQIFLNS